VITAHSTQPAVTVNRASPFRCIIEPLSADLQAVLNLVLSGTNILAAETVVKSYTVRQQYVLTRLLQAHASGLNLAMCGERLALAASRQFDVTA